MIELTQEQRVELSGPEPIAIDPETREVYVLVRREVYDRMRSFFHEHPPYTSADTLDGVMAEDDANDPFLEELQKKYGATS